MKRILLHVCCGPCSTYVVESLRAQDFEVFGYFYNPNIHPYTEFKQRRDSAQAFFEQQGLKLIVNEEYGLEEFLRAVVYRERERCRTCYYMRLKQTAKVARKGKFDYYTTTLLISPFQKHEELIAIGEAIGKEEGIPFYYEDFRVGYKLSRELAKSNELYRQQYCGCIYSEQDRYYRPQKKL